MSDDGDMMQDLEKATAVWWGCGHSHTYLGRPTNLCRYRSYLTNDCGRPALVGLNVVGAGGGGNSLFV